MSSLVLDLQQEVLNKDCDILNALRKAHLIASKLQLKEFDIWIQHELNGYENCSRDEIPNYRTVKGCFKRHLIHIMGGYQHNVPMTKWNS